MVQLDHDEEKGLMHGMYGTIQAVLEIHHTIKRFEQTAFLCLLREASGLAILYVDKKGIIDVLWKGEMKYIGPKGKKDADLWIAMWRNCMC